MRNVLIFGVGKGFGLSMAKQFGRDGKFPIMVARNKDHLSHFKSQLQQKGIRSTYFTADVTKREEIKNVFKQVKNKYGVPETLIYNVGDKTLDNSLSASIDKIDQEFKTNVLGAVQSIRSFLALIKHDDYKHNILITGGGAGLHPSKNTSTLSLTKAALRSYVYSLYDEIKNRNIYLGLVTIQGISGHGKRMQPDNVARIYVQATHEQKHLEIFYPHNKHGQQSDIKYFKSLK